MMYRERLMGLHAGFDANVVLRSVDVDVVFNNLLCETLMKHVYQNLEERPIEAVYTFPLSSQATLLSLKVSIGGKELHGVVVEKSSAESQYEDSLVEGNAAIMLEQAEPGIYTMNVGNILPGENVSISIRYAELYYWQEDTVRFMLPTTIAPRYGDPEMAGLQPHQIPETDLLAENRFRLKITMMGKMADSVCQSPSHQIDIQKLPEKSVVTLSAGQAFMDRDFILNLRSASRDKNLALLGNDVDHGYVALASFAPSLPAQEDIGPRSIKVLVDCSGSMAGDSISQARQAVSDCLKHLRPSDFFNIFCFGSRCRAFFEQQVTANKKNLTYIRRQLRSLEADMGGTEIMGALLAARNMLGPDMPQDILLITDGEVWDTGEIVQMARQSGHRIFTVGVGSAVSEMFVRRIADETGGACELVSPNEAMAEKIVHHFRRIFLPRADKVKVTWPAAPEKVTPKVLPAVFDGNTLHVFAFFTEKHNGKVALEMTLSNGQSYTQSVMLPDDILENIEDGVLPGTLARIAIQRSLGNEDKSSGVDLALKYQLISPWTNYLVLAERAESEKERSRGIPALRKVPQMLAAGWHGTGRVARFISAQSVKSCAPPPYRDESYSIEPIEKDTLFDKHLFDKSDSSYAFINSFNLVHENIEPVELKVRSFSDLSSCGLPDQVLSMLKAIADQYDPEASEFLFVTVFLHTLVTSRLARLFKKNARLAIKDSFKSMNPDEQLIQLMNKTFAVNDYWA